MTTSIIDGFQVASMADVKTYTGLVARKPVYGVSEKASFKPVSTATETSQKIETSPKASLHMILFQKANNKGVDQTARMRRLVCAFAVHKPQKTGFLASRSNYLSRDMRFLTM